MTLQLLLVVVVFATSRSPDDSARHLDSFEAAIQDWRKAAGLTEMGGYARYPEDDERASTAFRKLKNLSPPSVPQPMGSDFAWTREYSLQDDTVDTGACTMAATETGMHYWHHMAQRGVTQRPLKLVVRCKHIHVTVTLRDPGRPSPNPKLDLLSVVQTVPETGRVHFEWAHPFRFPAAAATPADGPRGVEYERNLLAAYEWSLVAPAIGPAVEATITPEMEEVVKRRPFITRADPALHRDVDIIGGGPLDVPNLKTCVSAAVLGFLRDVHFDLSRGLELGRNPVTYRFEVLCPGGHAIRILRDQVASAELVVTKPDTRTEIVRKRFPLIRLEAEQGGKERAEWFDMSRLNHTRPPARTVDGRMGWFQDRLGPVARLAGASREEAKEMEEIGWPLIASGTLESLGVGKPRITCQSPATGAPKRCHATPAIDLPQPGCMAVAWALAAALPHLPKAPFKPTDTVELEVACGFDVGGDLTVTALRQPDPHHGLLVTLTGSGRDNGHCEATMFGIACDEEALEEEDLMEGTFARRLVLSAPVDPSSLKPIEPPKPGPGRGR